MIRCWRRIGSSAMAQRPMAKLRANAATPPAGRFSRSTKPVLFCTHATLRLTKSTQHSGAKRALPRSENNSVQTGQYFPALVSCSQIYWDMYSQINRNIFGRITNLHHCDYAHGDRVADNHLVSPNTLGRRSLAKKNRSGWRFETGDICQPNNDAHYNMLESLVKLADNPQFA